VTATEGFGCGGGVFGGEDFGGLTGDPGGGRFGGCPRELNASCGGPTRGPGIDYAEGEGRTRPPGQYFPTPKVLEGFPGTYHDKPKTPVRGGGGLRPRWKDQKGKIYEFDRQHGTVEIYSRSGQRHLGDYDHRTGRQVGPARPERRVEK
jgi:hypothetical protein